uniref:Aminopeptidase n=2 Tax=Caenorhabditis japonica TaxID=281687 RepID=A0A8R1HI27_CAEJA
MILRRLTIILLLTTLADSATNLDTNISQDGTVLLSSNIQPVHYDVHLKTYLPGFAWEADTRNLTFEGEVVITADVIEATDRIILHVDSLNVFDADVKTNDPNINITKWEVTPQWQSLTLHLSQVMEPQEGIAFLLKFRGKLRDDGDFSGFYLTRSYKSNGDEVLNAVTQFDPNTTRSLIPCFDEPGFKTTWQLALEYPVGSVGLTNGIEMKTVEINGEWATTQYHITEKMSPDQLAVFVGNVQYKEAFVNQGVRIRIFADPENLEKVDFALNVSYTTIKGFEEKFGINYQMQNLDFLAVRDFKVGATKTRGLIVHRSSPPKVKKMHSIMTPLMPKYPDLNDSPLEKFLESLTTRTLNSKIARFAFLWTRQAGLPTVIVSKTGSDKIEIKQEIVTKSCLHPDGCFPRWDIPIWYHDADSSNTKLTWLLYNLKSIQLNSSIPLIINADSNGLYKVLYTDELYEEIGEQLKKFSKIYSPSTKYRLLTDASEQVWKRNKNASSFLPMIEALIDDDNEHVRRAAKKLLAFASRIATIQLEPENPVVQGYEDLLVKYFSSTPSFANFSGSATFLDVFGSEFDTQEILISILIDKNFDQMLERLVYWQKTETDPKILEIIGKLLDDLKPSNNLIFKIGPAEKQEEWRLPTKVFPIDYNLELTTYLPGYGYKEDEKTLKFHGAVDIKAHVVEATDRIVLNADSLEIQDILIDTKNVTITRWQLSSKLQFLTIYLSKTIEPKSTINFTILYEGKIREDLKGYYLTRTSDNSKTLNAVTQFESTAARFMVPCFDEPEFKATWKVKLIHPDGTVALSNGIEMESGPTGDTGFTYTEFARTVKMSSYLLAVFVGDVQYKETVTDRGVRIRVYADPQKIDMVDYALNVSRVTVEGFEKQFGIEYPMEKIDFVAVEDFAFGAMENWGLIIHASSYILGKSKNVLSTVIHELAHQWFGNLVTMKFWDNLWLNEGFASYMTPYGYTFIDPEADRDFSQTSDQEYGLNGESEPSTSITKYVRKDDGDITNTGLIYSKGSSFIRMIEHIMGADNFNKAIRYYLNNHQYQNVVAYDLYEAFERFMPNGTVGPNGKPFNLVEFAKCWTHQSGYPTIQVQSIDNSSIQLTQHRRLYKNVTTFKEEDVCGHKWDVPIWYQVPGSDTVDLAWLGRNDENLVLNVTGPVVINANSNGYYRVLYSNQFYELLSTEFQERGKTQFLSDSSKIRLLNDIMNFIGEIDAKSILPIVETLANDDNLKIRQRAEKTLRKLKNQTGHSFDTDMTKPLFEKCSLNESFDECSSKIETVIMDEFCRKVRSDPSQENVTRYLLNWLNVEERLEYQSYFLKALSCADSGTLDRLLLAEYRELRKRVNFYMGMERNKVKMPAKQSREFLMFEHDV